MRNNDINDEDFGKEIPDASIRNQTEPTWAQNFFAIVTLACVGSVAVALTLRLDRWLLS